MLNLLWKIFCCVVGAIIGAILISDFESLLPSVAGVGLGGVVGWLMGKYIPIYEWFA
ncbi:hypothetical protein OAN47_01845 [Planctomycetota bacterium]|nr:hypothetical protein [Planctomycetota bacterium]MDC3251935.1 hypothetical protein [Planctomycetota bacterium]